MKTIKFLLFIALILKFVISSGQTADVTQGCIPLEVNFTAPTGSTSYYWDFKDGVTSNKQNPINIFSKAGTYNVTFHSSPGGPVIGTVQIKVYGDPVLNVNIPVGCAPLNAQMNGIVTIDPAIAVNRYVWVYGDGTSSAGAKNTTHMYPSVGRYSVSFSIETNFPTCNRTEIFTNAVEVLSPPVASFTNNPSNIITCRDTLDVNFTNNSSGVRPLTYSWNLGNGTQSVLRNPPQQRYFKGLYNPALTVSYTGITGCSSSTSRQVSVGRPTPVITTKKDSVCINTNVVFKTVTPGTYQWNVGPNGSSSILNRDSVVVVFNKPGFQTVSLTVTSLNGQCFDTKTYRVYVDEVTATITSSDPTFSCRSPKLVHYNGGSNQTNVTFTWALPDTTIISKNAVRSYYNNAASIYYSKNDNISLPALLTVTSNKTGCQGTATRKDTLWVPNALTMPDKTKGCIPLTIQFSDSSKSFDNIVRWEWLPGNGAKQVNSTNAKFSYTYTTPGEYAARLVVTTQKGCIDTSYAIQVEAGTNLSSAINFTADKTSVCPGEEVEFSTTIAGSVKSLIDAYHFSSEGNRVSHCFDEDVVKWSYNNLAGPQNVSLTVDYNGCFSTVTKTNYIDVKGAIAKIDYEAFCNAPFDYDFNDVSSNATSVSWDFGDGSNSTTRQNSHTYAATGDYVVTLTASNNAGCAANTDTAIVNVRNIKAKINMDTLICISAYYNLSGANSVDVYADCHTGFTWEFPTMDKRPVTTSTSTSTFNFNTPGYHTVRLITKDVNGCKDTTYKQFKVYDMTVSAVASKYAICNPMDVDFDDTSVSDTAIASWSWNFGDGNASTLQNPTNRYLNAPSGGQNGYNVILRLTDRLGCSESTSLSIRQYAPTTVINATDETLCLGDRITLSASDFTQEGSHLIYDWDLGNGQTSTASSISNVFYPNEINYTATLRFTEASSGCQGVASKLIQVQGKPQAVMTTNVDTVGILCAPQNVFFRDQSISNFPLSNYYDFGNGSFSYQPNYDLFYQKGTYVTTHIVKTSFGCADTVQRTFRVYRPEGEFDMSRDLICKGEEVTFSIRDTADISSYTWAFGDGTILNDQAPVTHQYNFHPPSGWTIAKLTLVSNEGCQDVKKDTLFIHQVIADFDRGINGDTSICYSQGAFPFVNTSTGQDTYMWFFGDGSTSTTLNPSHTYASTGEYDVTLVVSNATKGCADTISKKAIVYGNPVVVAVGDTVCQGKTLHPSIHNPVASSSYLWTPATGVSDVTSTNPVLTINHSIIYNVIETDANGCTGEVDVAAIVIEPIGLSDWDTSIVVGDEISLPVFGPSVYNFKWTPETGLSCLSCNYPKVRPIEDIVYQLEVTDKRNCFYDSYLFDVKVRPETFISLPTTFTPNGDGNNDIIYVKGWGIKELLEFQVYDRWGQMIYSSSNINEGWDGKFKGVLQNSDVYAYKVKAMTWRNEELYNEGFINLLY